MYKRGCIRPKAATVIIPGPAFCAPRAATPHMIQGTYWQGDWDGFTAIDDVEFNLRVACR